MREIKIIKNNEVIERQQLPNRTAESPAPGRKRWTEIEAVESWVKIWRERKNREIRHAFDQLNAVSTKF